jgi:tRNA(Ile)-lysidine synthase
MLLGKVRQTIARHRMVPPGGRVVLAVSGGPDSVALCHLFSRLRSDLAVEPVVAHVHHGLRGREADEDALFVTALGHSLDLPVVVRHLDVRGWQRDHGGSLQMVARTLRYRCLREVMVEENAGRLALGHTADDQAEEILLRLFRGAGPRGLRGMPAVNGNGMIRPLLGCHRLEIVEYLGEHGLACRQDSSNSKPWCQRNRLRLEVLPLLRRCFNSSLDSALLRTAAIFQEEEDFWESLVETWIERHARRDQGPGISFPANLLLEAHPALQRRVLRRGLEMVCGHLTGFGFHHVDLILGLCRSQGANREIRLPNLAVAEKSYGLLGIRPLGPRLPLLPHEISGPASCYLPELDHTLLLEDAEAREPIRFGRDPSHAVIDRDTVSFPLLLRFGRPGDRFRPLGLGGSKKLKDFFMDVKVSRSRRRLTPVLCDRDRIIWVVGHRIDDRVKITARTRRLLRLEYRSGRVHPEEGSGR